MLTKYESESDSNIKYKRNSIKEKTEQKISNNSYLFENQELFQNEIKSFLLKGSISQKIINKKNMQKYVQILIIKLKNQDKKKNKKKLMIN